MKTNRPFDQEQKSFKSFLKKIASFLSNINKHECLFKESDIKRITKIWSTGTVNFKFRYPDEEEPIRCIKCGKALE